MNIAFYVDNPGENDLQKKIFDCLNDAVENFKVEDASLFFENPTPFSNKAKFGIFNSTELWAYTGLLISTTLRGTMYAKNIANKFKLFHLFSSEKDIFSLIRVGNMAQIITLSKEDQQEVYRLTGKMPKLVELKAESLIEALK